MMAKSKRITVRVDDTQLAKIQEKCALAGCDLSTLVRLALDSFGASCDAETVGSASPPRTVPSDSAITAAESPGPEIVSAPEACPTAVATQKNQAVQPLAEPSYPAKVADLLPHCRAHGVEIWKERRRLFQRLLAAAEVARENAENPRDAALRHELLRVGQEYGLLH